MLHLLAHFLGDVSAVRKGPSGIAKRAGIRAIGRRARKPRIGG
jgi:hypothetical protein